MEWLSSVDPIIACSTENKTRSALGIVRLSGFSSLSTLQSFFTLKLEALKPRYSHLTYILSPDTGDKIDHVLIVYFPGPNSFTGENVLEITCHGNPVIVDMILDVFVKFSNFRIAGPGEFSYRAHRNKKLSLTQVEGLDLILNSNSRLCLQEGLKLLNGELYEDYSNLYDDILHLKSLVELAIDFSDDVGEDESSRLIEQKFSEIKSLITKLVSKTSNNPYSIVRPRITLSGPVNSGKSSLFNFLLNDNRSIISDQPGTTRDFVNEYVYFQGNHFFLTDTAGIRGETDDLIEKEGIARGERLISESFFKILVFDFSCHSIEEFKEFLARYDFDFVCFTHYDLIERYSELSPFVSACLTQSLDFVFLDLKFTEKSGPMGPDHLKSIGSIGPSYFGPIEPEALDGPIEPFVRNEYLFNRIMNSCMSKYRIILKNHPIFIDRQKQVLKKLKERCDLFDPLEEDVGILSYHVNALSLLSSELIGQISPNDVLNNLFSSFCIGK